VLLLLTAIASLLRMCPFPVWLAVGRNARNALVLALFVRSSSSCSLLAASWLQARRGGGQGGSSARASVGPVRRLRRCTYFYVCMYVKIRRHQHTRVHAHTGPHYHYESLYENTVSAGRRVRASTVVLRKF